MQLWFHWWSVASQLRPACSRRRTFFWLMIALAALCTRADLAGVTSFVRALGLRARCYGCLLDFFHSPALCPDRLARVWARLVLRIHPGIERCNGRLVVLADGLKKGKCGRQMPAVKLLHQSGESNTKPTFIMGHSCQALALLGRVGRFHHALPLCARIHEGLIFSNRDQRTLLDKLLLLLKSLELPEPVLLIADAYYASGKIVRGLFARGGHLISRVKSNACAFEPAAAVPRRRRGRPRLYARKLRLRDLFDAALQTMPSPAYGEHDVCVQWTSRDLLWRPTRCLVRFVAVIHPTRGRLILMSTDLSLPPSEIIRLYALRFKIEVSFKHALHTLGAWAYHFWMMDMLPIKRGGGDQFLHTKKTEAYRHAVHRKLCAYHRHIQIGLVAQGLLQCLAALQPKLVWNHFSSWLRTTRSPACPSELVVATALRHHLSDFLAAGPSDPIWRKFLRNRLDPDQLQGALLAA